MRRRTAFHWALRCAGREMNVDAFLTEVFKLELTRHGADDTDSDSVTA